MSLGLEQLREAVALAVAPLVQEIAELREAVAHPPSRAEVDTRPLTAAGLMERWGVAGADEKQRMHNLAARCRKWGLSPMPGTEGMRARYRLKDVLSAEEYAGPGLRIGVRKPRRRRAAA